MLHRDHADQVCSIARALEVIGERWSLLILRDVFLGRHRFDDLQESLGITRSVLSTRLVHLVDHGVVERRPYQTNPERFEYHATAKGAALLPVLGHLLTWGDHYYPEPEGPPRILRHRDCGGRFVLGMVCERCGAAAGAGDIVPEPGPALLDRGLASEGG